MSIGFFELVVVLIVTVLALKPEQLASTVTSLRRHVLQFRRYTSSLEQEFIAQEKASQLQQRIEAASKVSDVSDLLPEQRDESSKQS